MVDSVEQGRHRAPGRYNPLSELRTVAGRSAAPAVKTSAVLAASGGLVAALAIPAAAAPATTSGQGQSQSQRSAASLSVAPAVVAPAAAAPVAGESVGLMTFTAVAKPKPKPKPVVVPARTVTRATQATQVSRSAVRSAPAATTSSSQDRAAASTKAAASGVLAVARSLFGIYYVYGGSTPAGFDCSGFTQYVFNKVGISLPRTAAAQQSAATRISNPQPGDLVFFGSPAYHVGIYAGGGMMYDSPTTGKTTGAHKIWSSNVSYGRP